jgi:aryl-alcohol dehydrogenase
VQIEAWTWRAPDAGPALEGSSVPDDFIPRLIELHRQGRLPYDRFCRSYAFSEMPRALEDVAAGRAIKAIIC